MPRFEITTPSGRRFEVTAPEGASQEEVLAFAQKHTPESSKAEDPKAGRSFLDEAGHQLGLTARAAVQGVATIPAMLSDAATGLVNEGLDATVGKGNGSRFRRAQDVLGEVMTKAGLPAPETATERVVQDVSSAMTGVGTFAKAGQVVAKSAKPVIAAVGEKLAAGPGLQVTSGGTGAGAAGVVRENGGGPGAQAAAGLAATLAPGVGPLAARAGVRAVMRGGEAGRVRAEENLKVFEAAGTTPTLGQATEGRVARATEALLAKTPGGAGVIAKKAQQQVNEMAQRVDEITSRLSSDATAASAGESIMRAMQGFKTGFKSIQGRLYDTLDQHIPQGTPITVGNTEFALKQLNADIPGAPNLSELFKNARIQGIDKALYADLEQAATSGSLPYEAVKKLRTLVGNEIADASFVSDVPRSKWTPLYAALSEDLGEAAKKSGPQAEQAWQWANTFTKTQLARMEELSSVLSKDAPEKVFNAALSGTAQGDTIVRRIVSAMPKSERKEFAAAVLQRLGRATPGQQNAEGQAFSSESFLTGLSRVSPAARETIFGRTGDDELYGWVQQIAKVAESRREGARTFANPSGTASSAAQLALGSGAIAGLVTGNPVPLASAAAVAGGANLAARAVTSPRAAQIAASRTPVIAGTEAAAVEAPALLDHDPARPPSLDAVSQTMQRALPVTGGLGQPTPSATPARPAATIPVSQRPRPAAYTPVSQRTSAADHMQQLASATNVDDAIAAAGAALDATPAAPPPELVAAVQPEPVVPAPPADVVAAPEPGLAEAPLVADGGAAVPGGERSKEPAATWFGRAGDGYQVVDDAAKALLTRQKVSPELDWRIEQMTSGKYRLAGYGRPEGDALMAGGQPQQPQQPDLHAEITPSGTARLAGNEGDLRRILDEGGVTSYTRAPDGSLLVGRSQAMHAMLLIAAKHQPDGAAPAGAPMQEPVNTTAPQRPPLSSFLRA